MAGTGLPGAEILVAQGQLILKANGASESELKQEREVQKRLIDILVREKDEKAARTKLAVALKDLLAAMPESEKKALGDVWRSALRGAHSTSSTTPGSATS